MAGALGEAVDPAVVITLLVCVQLALAVGWLALRVCSLERRLTTAEMTAQSRNQQCWRQAAWQQSQSQHIKAEADPEGDPEGAAPISADSVQYAILPGVAPLSLGAKLRHDRVSVLDFGGKNDGVTDCTNAIQQAINLARSQNTVTGHGVEIFFPAGGYLVTKTLRVTDMAGGGVWFTGELNGITEWEGTGVGSCIIGRTDGVVFDCAGSQYL